MQPGLDPTPTISVIIPIYNGEAFLTEAITSIRQQQIAPVQIIIVDDGSTDGTARLVQHLGADLHYVYQDNAGPAAARNRGVRLAHGDLITFLDADDMWASDKLEGQVRLLQQHPHIDCVLGHCRYLEVTPTGWAATASPILALKVDCALFRRRAFDMVGLFDETLRISDDIDWFMRARERGAALAIHEDAVHYYRRHTTNLTRDSQAVSASLLQAFRSSLARRKGMGDAISALANIPCLPSAVEMQ